MSIIGCILIAVIAQRWKPALIVAVIVGLLGSTVFGFLHWNDIHYGSSPTLGYMAFYVATGTAAFVAETMTFFGIKIGIKALWARKPSKRTSQPTATVTSTQVPVTSTQIPEKQKALNVATIIASSAVVIVVLTVAVLASLQPLRDHLRKRYGFERPKYYNSLPADTDANRALVAQLLADRDRDKIAMKKALEPQTPPGSHGRTSSVGDYVVGGQPFEPPESLADGYEFERSACHRDWGLLDRTFDLCRSVDQSTIAAEHYARDVENYWIPRLRPTSLIAPGPLVVPSK